MGIGNQVKKHREIFNTNKCLYVFVSVTIDMKILVTIIFS